MRQREARGNKKRPTRDRLSAVNEFFRHKRPDNRPEDAARCRWRDGRHRRPSRLRIRGKPVFFGCCGVWDGQGEPHVKAGLSTADTTTPCPASRKEQKMKSLLRSAALPGERGSAPHAKNVRTVHRGPGSSSPTGPPCKFSFLRPFPQTFTDFSHTLAISRRLMIKW